MHLLADGINPSSQYLNGTHSFTQAAFKSCFLAYIHLYLEQWFPNFFGPPPPWFHIHTDSAPLPLLKKHKCAFVSIFILYLKKSIK
jgi:hypothetical protein